MLHAIGIGELLWDRLPSGERLGGAPLNVIAHLRRFGVQSSYISAVGPDDRARRALDELQRLGIDTSLIQHNVLPTGVVTVALDAGGTPSYLIASPAAYEAVTDANEVWPAGVGRADILVFGTLAQRFAGTHVITRRLAASLPDAIRLYDVNLRPGSWEPDLIEALLLLATIVKVNRDESLVLARALRLPAHPLEAFARAACDRFGLRGVCVTLGSGGASMLLDGRFAHGPAVPVDVMDTVGAGDAFAAAMSFGIAEGRPIAEILARANRLGGIVASREGAIPAWDPGEILPGSH